MSIFFSHKLGQHFIQNIVNKLNKLLLWRGRRPSQQCREQSTKDGAESSQGTARGGGGSILRAAICGQKDRNADLEAPNEELEGRNHRGPGCCVVTEGKK